MPRHGGPPRSPAARAEAAPRQADEASLRVERACAQAVAGRRALREVATWIEGTGVNEPEFQLLWLLAQQGRDGASESAAPDQGEMAVRLATSAGQVSGVVERLRQRGLVERLADRSDRRRQLWRLADGGAQVVRAVVERVTAGSSSLAPSGEGGGSAGIPPLAPPCEGGGRCGEAAA